MSTRSSIYWEEFGDTTIHVFYDYDGDENRMEIITPRTLLNIQVSANLISQLTTRGAS